jgi:2-keto-4-pentenoate hydratase
MNAILNALQVARAAGKTADVSVNDLPSNAVDAYVIALEQVKKVGAWKIGGANPWSQAVFENEQIFFGPISTTEMAVETPDISIAGLHAPLAEPELMIQLGDWHDEDLSKRFTKIGFGFEIPASVLSDAAKGQLTGQMVDRAGAGALWIGAVTDFDADLLLHAFTSEFQHNTDDIIAGGSHNIIGGPLGAINDFLAQAVGYNLSLAQGQWIATGGLNPAVPIAQGDQLSFMAAGREISVAIT